jgi:hypothetical protein
MPKYRYISGKKKFNDVITSVSKYIWKNMQIWFKMDLTQSLLRTSFQIFSIVFPFLLMELRHLVSLTLYTPLNEISFFYMICSLDFTILLSSPVLTFCLRIFKILKTIFFYVVERETFFYFIMAQHLC